MTPPVPKELEALLAHAGWIRSLARTLVSDPHRADDLVQQTWVAALEHPPGPSVSLQRWLAAVMRNFARQVRRGELRRIDRESRSAHAEARPSAHETVEAIAVQRELFEAVIGLDEPYRTTIFERFYEDLPPREIARRHGIPVKTVKTRLTRGLEKLRVDLDRRHGGRREAWLPALLPLAGWPGLPAPTVGMLLMNTKVKIAAAALALVGTGAIVWNAIGKSDAGTNETAGRFESPPHVRSEDYESLAISPTTYSPRENAAVTERQTGSVVVPTGPGTNETTIGGRVIDLDGLPVAGVPLRWSQSVPNDPPAASSRPDGSFELPIAPWRGLVVAAGPDFSTVFGAAIHPAGEQKHLLVVVAPRGAISGVVVDETGRPIEGATVEIHGDRQVLIDLEEIADQASPIQRRARTDVEGRFELPDAPATSRLHLLTNAPGYEGRGQATPDRATDDLRIVLASSDHVVLRGEVVDPAGARVGGAWVACAGTVVATDPEGRFVLEPGTGDRVTSQKDTWPSAEVVIAVKAGFRPSRFGKPAEGWPEFITLRFDGEPLEIRGRVVDPAGVPLAGISVMSRGEEILGGVAETPGSRADERTIESLLRGRGLDDLVKTDDDGRFAFGGLLDRSYDLAFFEKETLRIASVPSVAAGREDLLVVMSSDEEFIPVRGRAESSDGKPVHGLQITAVRNIDHGNPGEGPWSIWGPTAIADEHGRFDLGKLPPEGLWFQAIEISIEPIFNWAPPPGMAFDDLSLPVLRRCHLQVDLGDAGAVADSFQVLDEDGQALRLARWSGSLGHVGDSQPIRRGRSEVVAVAESGRTIVLRIHGREVLRQPVRLVPGEVVSVRP